MQNINDVGASDGLWIVNTCVFKSEVFAQLFGASLIRIAVLNRLARNVTDRDARRAKVFANLTQDVVGFVVILIGQLAGIPNALGWSNVAIYLLLALGFGYVQFMQPRGS